MSKIAIIILAAGSSSRLGSPKQLLSYQHKSLLSHTIEAAKNTADSDVVVILGDKHAEIAVDIEPLGVKIIFNTEWEEGMSSSIRTGLSALLDLKPEENTSVTGDTDLDGVILTVCDQPFLSSAVLQALADQAKHSGKSIVASAYKGTLGTPVYFAKQHFQELLELKGAEGARKLLKKHEAEVASVPFEKGEIDIDTQEDYQKLISQ
jgi:molybdenum cofactor cytidylyltransferase